MNRLLPAILVLGLMCEAGYSRESTPRAEAYLITCGPGTETYSIYGHSALRVFRHDTGTDTVYNWGVFDFETPNFAWKFARGRLDYMLVAEKTERFLMVYNYEKRYVVQQKIFLDSLQTESLLKLVWENLKPENARYKYDFFYDDCSTRIRDLIEKVAGGKIVYPPEEKKMMTFRDLTDRSQEKYPWLKLGIDLIMGSPGERKASLRESMFLPDGLQSGLSAARLQLDGRLIPLLSSPLTLVDFPAPVVRKNIITGPSFIAALLMIAVIVSTLAFRNKTKFIRATDIFLFVCFSILAGLMIFFNFFTDHIQMRWNLNILWLNPFIIICLAALILRKEWVLAYRLVFFCSAAFLVLQFILPQEFNIAFTPLAVILLVRSSVRADLSWNPLNVR